MSEALSRELTNPGHDDRWTCPGCYQDLATHSEGTFTCENCERQVECTLDSQPVCRASLVGEDDKANDNHVTPQDHQDVYGP